MARQAYTDQVFEYFKHGTEFHLTDEELVPLWLEFILQVPEYFTNFNVIRFNTWYLTERINAADKRFFEPYKGRLQLLDEFIAGEYTVGNLKEALFQKNIWTAIIAEAAAALDHKEVFKYFIDTSTAWKLLLYVPMAKRGKHDLLVYMIMDYLEHGKGFNKISDFILDALEIVIEADTPDSIFALEYLIEEKAVTVMKLVEMSLSKNKWYSWLSRYLTQDQLMIVFKNRHVDSSSLQYLLPETLHLLIQHLTEARLRRNETVMQRTSYINEIEDHFDRVAEISYFIVSEATGMYPTVASLVVRNLIGEDAPVYLG